MPKAEIIIVDDVPDSLTALRKILSENNYRVRPVLTGEMALKAVKEKTPDLILLDILMPGMNGYETCRVLKASPGSRNIPVLFLSALDETPDKIKAFEVGGVDFITKPFQAEEVLARVNTHIELQRTRKSLEEKNRELELLTEMGHALQACRKEAETFPVIIRLFEALFPGSSGSLCAGLPGEWAVQASWGDPPEAVPCSDDMRIWEKPGYLTEKKLIIMPVRSRDGDLATAVIYPASEPEDTGALFDFLSKVTDLYALAMANIRLREKLRTEAIRDPLTGLYNRRHMEAALEREAHRVRRRKSSFGLVMADIDYFKQFNDRYGHDAGDRILREIGKLIVASLRGDDIACRYGGEEFLLILPDADAESLAASANRLREKIRAHTVVYQSSPLQITVSMGAALFQEASEIDQVILMADKALYQAKETGRDSIVIL